MNKKNVISMIYALLLTLAGGFTDAYTFIHRGGVFATMQTGNLIKFFISVTKGEFKLLFILPIIFFIVGCVIAALLRKCKYQTHITLISLLVSYIIAGFCPISEAWDIVCVSLLSIVGAMQFEVFRACLGNRYTSTMCTNNIRLLSNGIAELNLEKIAFYVSIIGTFVIGIVVGVFMGKAMGQYSIMPAASVFLIILILEIVTKIVPSNEALKIAD